MLVESNPFTVGTSAPQFALPDTISDQELSLANLKGEKGTVIMFICNHCPYVIHYNAELVRLATEYQTKGIQFIAISSNDAQNYPQDAPDLMKQNAKDLGFPFPYLYDEDQAVAKAYDAACTPDFYLFNAELKTVYHGRLDDSRPNSSTPVSGKDLRTAMDSLLTGKETLKDQYPSMGCNIKWKEQ
jgi:peroxiredoxin